MATSITLKTGNLTSQINVQNDAKAQAILDRAAAAIGATGTPQQRLDAVLANMVQSLQGRARDYDYHARHAATMAGLESDNKFEVAT